MSAAAAFEEATADDVGAGVLHGIVRHQTIKETIKRACSRVDELSGKIW
jgi:hypothetical protein